MSSFTATDRIGQLAVQLNDIVDSRERLEEYLAGRLGQPGRGAVPHPLATGEADADKA